MLFGFSPKRSSTLTTLSPVQGQSSLHDDRSCPGAAGGGVERVDVRLQRGPRALHERIELRPHVGVALGDGGVELALERDDVRVERDELIVEAAGKIQRVLTRLSL